MWENYIPHRFKTNRWIDAQTKVEPGHSAKMSSPLNRAEGASGPGETFLKTQQPNPKRKSSQILYWGKTIEEV